MPLDDKFACFRGGWLDFHSYFFHFSFCFSFTVWTLGRFFNFWLLFTFFPFHFKDKLGLDATQPSLRFTGTNVPPEFWKSPRCKIGSITVLVSSPVSMDFVAKIAKVQEIVSFLYISTVRQFWTWRGSTPSMELTDNLRCPMHPSTIGKPRPPVPAPVDLLCVFLSFFNNWCWVHVYWGDYLQTNLNRLSGLLSPQKRANQSAESQGGRSVACDHIFCCADKCSDGWTSFVSKSEKESWNC